MCIVWNDGQLRILAILSMHDDVLEPENTLCYFMLRRSIMCHDLHCITYSCLFFGCSLLVYGGNLNDWQNLWGRLQHLGVKDREKCGTQPRLCEVKDFSS